MSIDVYTPADFDETLASELVELRNAACAVDSPHQPPSRPRAYLLELLHGWDGHGPDRVLALRDATGRMVGVAEIHVSHWEDNQHFAFLALTVHPEHRRRGFGGRLLEAATGLARDWGKTLLVTDTWADSAGETFAKRHGYEPVLTAAERRLDLTALDRDHIDALHDEAAAKAAGYELVRVEGRAPEDMVPDLVAVHAAINDAPLDDLDVEDEVFSAERVRAFDAAMAARERRLYRLLVRRTDDGAWAGQTVVAVDADLPHHAGQLDTSVVVDHRGHRLGMLLKTAMLRWLREAEPQLTLIDTWNAESNTHMIAVNDSLGCFVVGREVTWQRHL